MIGFTRYIRCDNCLDQMTGIVSDAARKTCRDCGGRALIGERPGYQALVRRAKERLGRGDAPGPPRKPGGREVA